jgi:site-specific DNA-methyltransferase (adenine-specific)
MKPYYETENGVLYHGDCLEIMPELEPVDLTVTSPPYDNLREYNGYKFDFEGIARELFRITKKGGVVVWVVGDATIDGSETGISFKQALYFKDVGFNIHDTMIYEKHTTPFPMHTRYNQLFEYMFILSNGKINKFNPIKTLTQCNDNSKSTKRKKDGTLEKTKYKTGLLYKIKGNIWKYNVGSCHSTKDKIAYKHPAIFPENLAQDHIISWSNPNDTILDIFFGSGTTGKMAEINNRKWIGIEISEEYCEIAAKRIENETRQLKLF